MSYPNLSSTFFLNQFSSAVVLRLWRYQLRLLVSDLWCAPSSYFNPYFLKSSSGTHSYSFLQELFTEWMSDCTGSKFILFLPLTYPYQQSFFDLRIIPQAVSVRYGLAVGATCAPLVLVMMYIFGSQNLPNFALQSKKKFVLKSFSSSYCLANCETTWPCSREEWESYLQESGIEVVSSVPSNRPRTPSWWWNFDFEWCFGT